MFDVRRLEVGNTLLLLGDEKAPQRRHVRLNGGAMDGRRIARLDELLGLARQRDDVVSDNTDADVMKIVVSEDRDVPLGIRQRMTFIAAGLSVEECPTGLGGVVNGVLVAGDEVIEWRIKGYLSAFVGRDGAQQVGTIGRTAKYAVERLLVFLDTRDLRHSRIQVWVTHLNGIDNRERRLLLERLHSAVPELRLIVKGIQNGRCIALADAAFAADGGALPVGEGKGGVMEGDARDDAGNQQSARKEKFLA